MSSRKVFEALSAALKASRPSPAEYGRVARWEQWHKDVGAVVGALAKGNQAFDANRFLTDCGAVYREPAPGFALRDYQKDTARMLSPTLPDFSEVEARVLAQYATEMAQGLAAHGKMVAETTWAPDGMPRMKLRPLEDFGAWPSPAEERLDARNEQKREDDHDD